MTNGLVKERMTYFCDNGIAYQAFNTILNRAKVLVYVPIDHIFVCCAEMNVGHKINEEELKCIAIEREAMIALEK